MNGAGMGGMFGSIFEFIGAMLAQDEKTRVAQGEMAELDQNASLAAYASGDALRRGQVESGRLRLRGTQATSALSAAYTAGGVDATVGTAADAQVYQGVVSELDAQTVENNAWREAFGYKRQSEGYSRQREQRLQKLKADNTQYSLNQVANIANFGLNAAKAGS